MIYGCQTEPFSPPRDYSPTVLADVMLEMGKQLAEAQSTARTEFHWKEEATEQLKTATAKNEAVHKELLKAYSDITRLKATLVEMEQRFEHARRRATLYDTVVTMLIKKFNIKGAYLIKIRTILKD